MGVSKGTNRLRQVGRLFSNMKELCTGSLPIGASYYHWKLLSQFYCHTVGAVHTTQNCLAYHQWYMCHQLRTPGLECQRRSNLSLFSTTFLPFFFYFILPFLFPNSGKVRKKTELWWSVAKDSVLVNLSSTWQNELPVTCPTPVNLTIQKPVNAIRLTGTTSGRS